MTLPSSASTRIPQPGTRIFWGLLFAYVLAIYLTLPIMRDLYAASFEIPEERIHFLQYALLGLLALRAIHIRHPLALLAALLLAATVGLIDEIIQFYLPNRVDDWHDVWMNAIGGALGVWFAGFFFWD